MTVVVWKQNGQKCPVTNIVDGNGVEVSHDINGWRTQFRTDKDGELVEE